jgi:rhodanese-related sulfurtransferase
MRTEAYRLIEPAEAREAVANGSAPQFVDVREESETAFMSVEGALNVPLSRLRELADRLERTRPVYLLCRTGSRAVSAAGQLSALGHHEIWVVRGGLEAWMTAGLPVVRGAAPVWSLERQVRFAAGALVFAGAALGALVHPAFYVLPAFVGLGLVFSAVTDTCGMALILARMPWNHPPAAARVKR